MSIFASRKLNVTEPLKETPAEYLEKISRESFDREIEQDETIWHALPFFAAGVGLLANFLAASTSALPKPAINIYAVVTYTLYVSIGLCLAVCTYYIWIASISRKYRRPPYETEICKYEVDLRAHYRGVGLTGPKLEFAILSDLRAHVLEEFSASATQNRRVNYIKAYARGRGMFFFLLASSVALALSATIFTHNFLLPFAKQFGMLREAAMTSPPPPHAPAKLTPTPQPSGSKPAEAKPAPPKPVIIIEQAPPKKR